MQAYIWKVSWICALLPGTAGEGVLQVDLDAPDYSQFPRAAGLMFQECLLSAGQMLYIPPGWPHYVKSLTPSISVSFWWD